MWKRLFACQIETDPHRVKGLTRFSLMFDKKLLRRVYDFSMYLGIRDSGCCYVRLRLEQ